MHVKIIAFGIAKDILQNKETLLETPDILDVGTLKMLLYTHFPDLKRLNSLAIAVNEDYQNDDYFIQEMDEVVLIPPVSGG